jgi:hypothetical protein
MIKKKKRSSALEAFFKSLQADWKGLYRKFPDQTIFVLSDERVVEAIEKRFAQQASIKDIRQLDYDFYSGLVPLCFEFAPTLGDLGTRLANAFLVILDGSSKVIALIDPFDPVQPNVFVPPLPQQSEQPFVLNRPSAAKHVSFSDEALYPIQVRSRAFFERLRGRGVFPDPRNFTSSSYQTWTPEGAFTDTIVDDCGPDTPILT